MNIKHISWHKTLPLIIGISLILVGLMLSTSCTIIIHSDSTYTPKVISDGTGGAIAVYEEVKSGNERDFYTQRISPDGKTLWGKEGTLMGSSQSESSSVPVFDIAGDGTGGALIAWPDLSQNTRYVTKVDSQGNILWRRDFTHFDQLISDGTGGAIIAFDRPTGYDNSSNNDIPIVVTRIDSLGNYTWGQQGITIPRQGYWPNSLQVISDGANGVIAVWEEMESQAEATTPNFQHTCRIMAQRVNAKGDLSWGENGITLSTSPENITIEEPCATADGSGGVIVGWHQYPSGPTDNSSPEWVLQDICTQKIDSSGNIQWQPGSVPLQIVKIAAAASPHTPLAVSDGSGGVIIMWEDLRNGLASIYAQRMNSSGASEWQTGGVKVCYVKSNSSFVWRQIAGDGSGGAVISCCFKEADTGNQGVRVQKVDPAGNTVWPNNGVAVTGSATTRYFLAADDQGGALVGWGIGNGSSENSFLQRVGSDGKLLWGTAGIKLGD
jgi:hypothetical protein